MPVSYWGDSTLQSLLNISGSDKFHVLLSHPSPTLASIQHQWGPDFHRHQTARFTATKRKNPARLPGPPAYQSRATTPLFFRARSTTDGGASIGAAPKLKSSFRGVKTGGICLVLCGAEKWAQRQGWDRMGPSQGWLAWHSLPYRWDVENQGQGQAQANMSDLKPIPDFSRPLQGWREFGGR